MRSRALRPILAALALLVPVAQADVPRSFVARIGGTVFESGDAEIVPVPAGGGAFPLGASTKGASDWQPPKTRVDRLAIACDGFEDGNALRLGAADFARSTCSVTPRKGARPMGGEPDEARELDKESGENRFEIVRADGKAYERRFAFVPKGPQGRTLKVDGGTFLAEDRQL